MVAEPYRVSVMTQAHKITRLYLSRDKDFQLDADCAGSFDYAAAAESAQEKQNE